MRFIFCMASLTDLLTRLRAGYRALPAQAAALAGLKVAKDAAVPTEARELAAWTAVANVLLNLDEVVTRE